MRNIFPVLSSVFYEKTRYFFCIKKICLSYLQWHLFHIGMIFESIWLAVFFLLTN